MCTPHAIQADSLTLARMYVCLPVSRRIAFLAAANMYDSPCMACMRCRKPPDVDVQTWHTDWPLNTLQQQRVCLLQIEQALRYTKAMGGKPDDLSLKMRPEEGLGGWAGLPLLQSAHAMWDDILAMPFPEATARGPCPGGGYDYAVAVYHYTRTLALAARCRAVPHIQACAQAEHELQLLQVAFSSALITI